MISIVTICPESYSRWIAECCVSVERQTVNDWEHIIVSVQSLSVPLIAKAFDTRLISLDHDPGLSTCRNIGVAAAKGDYIMMLDPDDWLAPDFIEKVTPHLDLDEFQIVSGSIQRFEEQDWFSPAPTDVSLNQMHQNNLLPYNSIFPREGIPSYDTKETYEDWDFWINLMFNYGYSVLGVPEAVLHYRVHSTSHTSRTWDLHEKRMQRMRERWRGVK